MELDFDWPDTDDDADARADAGWDDYKAERDEEIEE